MTEVLVSALQMVKESKDVDSTEFKNLVKQFFAVLRETGWVHLEDELEDIYLESKCLVFQYGHRGQSNNCLNCLEIENDCLLTRKATVRDILNKVGDLIVGINVLLTELERVTGESWNDNYLITRNGEKLVRKQVKKK